MINSFLVQEITRDFGFTPTEEQEDAIHHIASFLLSTDAQQVFLLRGYAGTGKTSLVGALVRTLQRLQRRVVLMAPTGRAAKVFAAYAGCPAYTIHKKIYRQKSITDEDSFSINVNLSKNTLFIVDEASMIANEGMSSTFGTGRLLDDLIHFVYSGEGCRLMLMGDTAQLPPIGEEESPALSPEYLSSYGLRVSTCTLTQVMRQLSESGILYNATAIRQFLASLSPMVSSDNLLRLRAYGFPDVALVNGEDLIESLTTSYSRWGMDECMVICRSNKRANIYNQGIRNTILFREDELTSGDRLMIVKNNYYWIDQLVKAEKRQQPMSFIANGDIAVVRRVRHTRELYGFRFADVVLEFPDYDDYELEATVLLDTLQSEAPALTREENEQLFTAVMEDYADIPQKKERYKQLRESPYYNALQVKYAQAVTCHKAQGGQWSTIYLDLGYLPPDFSVMDYYRWLYTAFTRATEQVYLVNWPKNQLQQE